MDFKNEIHETRLLRDVRQDQSGFWIWEVLDDEGPYLRSEGRFAFESEATVDLDKSCHLIRAFLD